MCKTYNTKQHYIKLFNNVSKYFKNISTLMNVFACSKMKWKPVVEKRSFDFNSVRKKGGWILFDMMENIVRHWPKIIFNGCVNIYSSYAACSVWNCFGHCDGIDNTLKLLHGCWCFMAPTIENHMHWVEIFAISMICGTSFSILKQHVARGSFLYGFFF